MRPELFALPLGFKTLPIYAYGFMVMLGFVAAIFLAARRARSLGVNPNHVVDLGLWTMISGIGGARLLYIVQFRQDFDWTLFHFFGQGLKGWPTLVGAGLGVGLFAIMRRGTSTGEAVSTLKGTPEKGRKKKKSSEFAPKSSPTPHRKARPLWHGALFVLVGAFVGHIAGNFGQIDFGIFRIDRGGLVFYGGLIGAAVVSGLYLWGRGANVWAVADCVGPSLALGLAFGRIGCFLNGCCWGEKCELPWAVRFPASYEGTRVIPNPVFGSHVDHGWVEPGAASSLPVHPTQLYASAGAMIIFLLLTAYFRRRRGDGEVFSLFCLFYGIDRFLIETFRADNEALFAGMTLSQNISVLVFVVGILFFVFFRRRGRSTPSGPAFSPASGSVKST